MKLSYKAASVLLATRVLASDPAPDLHWDVTCRGDIYTYDAVETANNKPPNGKSAKKPDKPEAPESAGRIAINCTNQSAYISGKEGSPTIIANQDGLFVQKADRSSTALPDNVKREISTAFACGAAGPDERKVENEFTSLRSRYLTPEH
jgi:hypothetical protein